MLTRVISGPIAGSVDTAPRTVAGFSSLTQARQDWNQRLWSFFQVDLRGQIVFFIHSKGVEPHAVFTFEIQPVDPNPP